MTRSFQSLVSGGNRKISGAHWCSLPMQNGQVWECELGLGFAVDLDLKSEGRRDLAGENMTQRLWIGSFRISGSRLGASSSAI